MKLAPLALAAAIALPGLASAQSLQITRAEDRPGMIGSAETFAGTAYVAPVVPPEIAGVSIGEVTFLPGARSAWHTHDEGQMLIVTKGTGWVQERGQPKQIMRAGDVVWAPPGVDHWHGATDATSVTHYAVQKGVTWGELVTDEDYAAD